jgi:intracellular multiplication protein IcmE
MERQRAEKAAPPKTTTTKPAQFDSQGVIQNTQPANQALLDQAAQDAYFRAQQLAEERRQKLAAVQSAMQAQAQQIYGSWNTVPMREEIVGIPETNELGEGEAGAAAGTDNAETPPLLPPVLRAGDILYAVLDTEVNSDYSDQAVMATIVHGKFKGARVLGNLAVGGPDGDALLLRFSSLSQPTWPASLSISALGVNPDTAQQGMASSVDHHYLQRWGTLFATSFLSGYADAVSSAGSASISADGSSVQVTQAPVSPAGRIMVGLGEVGKAASSEAQAYMNRPPTVILNAGVPVALLLTADVAQPTNFSIDGDGPITVKEVLSTAPKNINEVREELNQ